MTMTSQEFKRIRQQYGTQKQFASRTGLSHSLIAKIERENRPVTEYTIMRLKAARVIE